SRRSTTRSRLGAWKSSRRRAERGCVLSCEKAFLVFAPSSEVQTVTTPERKAMAEKNDVVNGKATPVVAKAAVKQKRSYLKQADVPKITLAEALRVPQSLFDDFTGRPTAPHQLAMAVDISPTSSNWEDLSGAAVAYGLTEGASNAALISITDIGKSIVAPTEEGQDVAARVEAALKPTILRKFFDRYNRAKFPQDKIARNVLIELGVPPDRVDAVLEIIKRNGEQVGIIHQTKTGPFVAVDTPLPPASGEVDEPAGADAVVVPDEEPEADATTERHVPAQP